MHNIATKFLYLLGKKLYFAGTTASQLLLPTDDTNCLFAGTKASQLLLPTDGTQIVFLQEPKQASYRYRPMGHKFCASGAPFTEEILQ
jgi:hypothetical protein